MRGLDLFGGGDSGLDETRRVPGALQDCDERTAIQIDGVLRLVREVYAPPLIFVIFTSGSDGFSQPLLDVRFFRRRSKRASAWRVGVLIPDSAARRVRNSW